MLDVKQRSHSSETAKKLAALYECFMKEEDAQNAKKIVQLYKKWSEQQFVIAFCGHFSAGKSSMINELVGYHLLPSSPIPTSANLVSVQAGEEHATVYFKKSEPVRYLAPYDYEQIKAFAIDGDEIESIHLSIKTNQLPEGITVMDTPGIDSTDDAHRLATESALHLADVIFYVMDYNHVQSELNFQFTKELKQQGKKLYLIINQIDKHQDNELTFPQFKASVRQSFANWQVEPDDIFYTTLKNQYHTYNELDKVKQLLHHYVLEKKQYMEEHLIQGMKRLIDHHVKLIEKQQEEEIAIYANVLTGLPEQERERLVQNMYTLDQEQQKIENEEKQLEQTFWAEAKAILQNANLMPYETREKARLFIESCQEDFKVGFLFSKKKTEQERKERLARFYEDLKEKVTSQLNWHLQQFLQRFLKEHQLDTSDLLQEANGFGVEVKEEELRSLVKSGAGVTGAYILTFADDTANELKKRAERQLQGILMHLLFCKRNLSEQKIASIQEGLSRYPEYEGELHHIARLQKKGEETKSALINIMNNHALMEDAGSTQLLESFVNESFIVKEGQELEGLSPKHAMAIDKKEEAAELPSQSINGKSMAQAVEDVKKTIEVVSPFQSLGGMAKRLEEKAERLNNHQFTVALFGAFSAGKSSFANALIGEKLLPVSPNPTTATINKIMPPSPGHPHRTAKVHLKSKEQLFLDLKASLKWFGQQADSLEEALNLIQQLRYDENMDVRHKLHLSFLQAVKKGYRTVSNHLGEAVTVTIEEFHEYVAKEEKACFVQFIELYYDCELTQKGITLVDTPGADSINARHTDVAFEYIKNADAILFVTYYNHAFSKADREFLIQLGRVKDLFTLDKMFFIINAADLASSDDELSVVVKYVGQQLEQYGIRFPRLFPLSSLLALTNKEEANFKPFEEAFDRFISTELTQLVTTSAYEEISRTLQMVDELLKLQTQTESEKKARLQSIITAKQKLKDIVQSLVVSQEQQRLHHEIEELLYYVKQRVLLRYFDFFKESFNPASLRDDQGRIKEQLQACLEELLQSVGFDIAQEMRATSLRLETFIKRLGKEVHASFTKEAGAVDSTLQWGYQWDVQAADLTFVSPFEGMDMSRFKKPLTLYKNSKSFFEKNEKEKMSEQLKELMSPIVDEYVKIKQSQLADIFIAIFNQMVEHYQRHLLAEIEQTYNGLEEAITHPISIDGLKRAKLTLQQMI
ncbi:dynamin family protein [Bacillus songklensis]|uniref:Dynamin family protein n=1 Tax=Bacillus songklensis TaxID=1069116 RepID=A0ABV8B1G1_9BACI